MEMRLVFCGTPQFAVPSLEALAAAGHDVRLVVTQPDRAQGRGMTLKAPPVKQAAEKLNLAVMQPEKIRTNEEFRRKLETVKPDAIIVVGYGRLIPAWMLQLPPYGNINVHASLLPKYRGAAPVQWAIAHGETTTGVTTMLLNEGLDTGDILLQSEIDIRSEDTAVTLASRLASLGADLLVKTLRGLEQGSVHPVAQDHAQASLAPILKKEDGKMDFSRPAAEIINRLRGFQPWPGAHARFHEKDLKIIAAQAASQSSRLGPGVLGIQKDRLFIGCAGGSLELLQVQPEGKKAMSAHDFIIGYRPKSGDRLE